MKYFRTIEELPIWNFNKISETRDLRYMLKLEDYFDLQKHDTKFLDPIYETIFEQLFEKFGFDTSFINSAMEEKAMLLMELKVIAGDRSLKTVIEIKKHEIAQRKKNVPVSLPNFDKKVAILEAHFKVPFDVYKMSVLRFYNYVAIYSEWIRKNKKPGQ